MGGFDTLCEPLLPRLISHEERSEFGRKLVHHYPCNSDGANTYGTLTNSGQDFHAQILSVSLNRDGTTTWRMQPEEAEVRRRLWCKNLSLIIGLSI